MITTLVNLKVYLGITDNSQDALLNLLLQGASDQIEGYCCRVFTSSEYTELVDGRGTLSLFVKSYPITAFTSLEKNTGTQTTPVWELVSGDDYQVETDIGEIRLYSQANRSLKGYRVKYTGGYTTVPMDLQLACMKLTGSYYNARKADGILSESVADDSISFDTAVNMAGITPVLDKYRSPYV